MNGFLAVFSLFFLFSTSVYAENRMVNTGWYGPGFDGKFMANQQRFDKNDPTIAANRTLPFGTKLLVENPANGRKLIVIVQDRGPYVAGRDLDLSYAAARMLGFAEKGVTQLSIRELRE